MYLLHSQRIYVGHMVSCADNCCDHNLLLCRCRLLLFKVLIYNKLPNKYSIIL